MEQRLKSPHGLIAAGCSWDAVELLLADTCLWRTPTFSPNVVISIHFDLCNQDTSQLRTAVVSQRVSLFIIERCNCACNIVVLVRWIFLIHVRQVSCINTFLFPVLIDASKRGDCKKVEELYQLGGNLLATDQYGMTTLHHAARFGHKDLVKFLIDNG
jgi:ankyrin repeat protein